MSFCNILIVDLLLLHVDGLLSLPIISDRPQLVTLLSHIGSLGLDPAAVLLYAVMQWSEVLEPGGTKTPRLRQSGSIAVQIYTEQGRYNVDIPRTV